MTEQEIHALLSQPNHAIIGVNRPDGAPHLTPVWYAWDGTSFRFSTTKGTVKYANIKRDPSISLIVNDLVTRTYVIAYGRAEMLEQETGEGVRPILQKYVPAERLEQSVKEINDDPARVLVILHPEKILTR